MREVLSGCPCQVTEHIVGQSSFNALIRAVQLCPGFFHDENPQLLSICLGKARAQSLIRAREEVIDDYVSPHAILTDIDSIDSIIIDSLSDEKLAYSVRVFSKHR